MDDSLGDERSWPDPDARVRDWQRIGARVGVSAVLSAVVVVVFREQLGAVWPLLWPPMEPYGQCSTLVLLHLLGIVALPAAVGSRIGDRLYESYVEMSRG